ncbi:MAG: decaprenyl-phosphate phosphoribosyltransferase [Methanobacteriota archaeon]
MYNLIRLLRPHQWYKSIVIFLALFFTNNLFNLPLLINTVFGFVSFCMVSSAYYIINDIHDAEEDRKHPEKRKRPIASGEITANKALILSFGLFLASLTLAYALKPFFALFPVILYVLNILYTYYFRNIPLVDIHVISLNFILKAVAGAILIEVPASVWLIVAIYFIALFLAVSKRYGELLLLGDRAIEFKGVYEVYSETLLKNMILVVISVLLFTYIMYTFTAHESPYLMLTIPFATFMVFRYMYFISIGHKAVRKVQYIFTDGQMLVCFTLWIISSFLILKYVL